MSANIDTKKPRRPWLCRIGIHTSRYTDGALINSAPRCNNCGQWVDPSEGAKVDQERKLWECGEPGESMDDGLARVTRALFLGESN